MPDLRTTRERMDEAEAEVERLKEENASYLQSYDNLDHRHNVLREDRNALRDDRDAFSENLSVAEARISAALALHHPACTERPDDGSPRVCACGYSFRRDEGGCQNPTVQALRGEPAQDEPDITADAPPLDYLGGGDADA